MKKRKKIFTLLSLLVLFSTTISIPLARAKEKGVVASANLDLLEESSQSEFTEYDLKVLEIIKELETSDEGILIEEYQKDNIYTLSGAGVLSPGDYFIAGIGTVTVLVTGAIVINNKIWEAGSSMAKKIVDLLFSAKSEPVYKTDKEATKAAEKLGYDKISEKCGKAAIFKKGKKTKKGPEYISRDIDGHIGGAWKGGSSPEKLCSKKTRSGTYDKDLNRIGE